MTSSDVKMLKKNGMHRSPARAPLLPGIESLFSSSEFAELSAAADAAGKDVASYLFDLHRLATGACKPSLPVVTDKSSRIVHSTRLGQIFKGDARHVMKVHVPKESVSLIMTSPPYALVYKKDYGNEDADRYLDWFRTFVPGFLNVLKSDGSLVIDIGGVWKKGRPARSLYHFELLVMLCREYGLHLAQEFYWWNPAKLPTPAEWVNVRRIRVKDAVNCIWWLSKSEFPKASNRRVLQPYSPDMERLLVKGYRNKSRPSGHNISTKFRLDNKGSIPPNVIAIGNNDSNSAYRRYCQDHGLKEHPAQFPPPLPAFFVHMLTDPGDTVLDPFAGSCVTGAVCEQLNRRWACIEIREEYALAGRGRFLAGSPEPLRKRRDPYQIHPPAFNVSEDSSPLAGDGGRTRPRDRK